MADAPNGCADSLEAFVSLGLRFTKTRAVEGGLRVRAGQTVAVSYTCRLGSAEGRVLDASPEDAPLSVRAGRAAVVPGWDLALLRMCVGEAVALELPPSLAYGAKGNAKVPPAARVCLRGSNTRTRRHAGVQSALSHVRVPCGTRSCTLS